jgi:hypothetical protein
LRTGARQAVAVIAGRPALLFTVNTSPPAGVPLICTCQPLKLIFPPSV